MDSRIGLSATDDVAALQRLTVKIPDAVFSKNFLAWLGELDGRGVTVAYLDSQTAHNRPFPIRRVEEEDSDEEWEFTRDPELLKRHFKQKSWTKVEEVFPQSGKK